MRTAFVLLVAAGGLVAAPVPKDFKKADDAKLIVGTWMGTGSDTVRFAFAADGTLRTWQGQPGNGQSEWTWAVVDQNATPKKARITRTTAPAGQAFDCVYELTGDTLKFALIMNPEKGVPEQVERHPALQFFATTRAAPDK